MYRRRSEVISMLSNAELISDFSKKNLYVLRNLNIFATSMISKTNNYGKKQHIHLG